MNDVPEDDVTASEAAAALQIDAVLHELGGEAPAPGLAERILAETRRQRAAPERRASGPLVAALVVVGGLVVVGAGVLLRDVSREHAESEAAGAAPQEPSAADEMRRRLDAAVRMLELPERRAAAIEELVRAGSAALPRLEAALQAEAEAERGRSEVGAVIHEVMSRIGEQKAKRAFGWPEQPLTLVCDYANNVVLAIAANGAELWRLSDKYGCWDVEPTAAGTLLITEFSVSRIREIDAAGKVVWEFTDVKNPYDADRLPNGNTLIADTFHGRVLEVNAKKEVVWRYEGGKPYDAERLPNGNTLIADHANDRAIEVSPAGEVVWSVPAPGVFDADRLVDGNTLLTLRKVNRVVEVDPSGEVVAELAGLTAPSDADRLPNGNTLVAESGGVREFDAAGNVVWSQKFDWAVEVHRF